MSIIKNGFDSIPTTSYVNDIFSNENSLLKTFIFESLEAYPTLFFSFKNIGFTIAMFVRVNDLFLLPNKHAATIDNESFQKSPSLVMLSRKEFLSFHSESLKLMQDNNFFFQGRIVSNKKKYFVIKGFQVFGEVQQKKN